MSLRNGGAGDVGKEVAARPGEELNNVAKNIADCTELHLGRKGITYLTDDMEAFESLEVLWLNDNALSRIANLDLNPTIKSLYAHKNRIGTLKGSLLAFTFLHTLTLGNNQIGNLQGSLGVLKLMHHLRYLELSGNPLAEETGYRLLVIKNIPWLETLDMHAITDEERRAARHVRVPKSWQAAVRERHGDSVGVTQDLAAKETKSETWQRRRGSIFVPAPVECLDKKRTQAMLQKELSRMRCVVKQRRILLKEWFRSEDLRREESVSQSLFTRCLSVHGLWPPGAANPSSKPSEETHKETRLSEVATLSGETGLLAGILLEAFRSPNQPKRAAALGRDPVYLGQSFMDYISFCAAVEPKHGGRDLDNQERELDKAWKVVPPVGDLGDAVGNGKSVGQTPLPFSRSPASGRSGNSAEDGDDDGLRGTVLPAKAPMACEFIKSHNAGGEGQLDHWERLELKCALENQGGTASTSPATTAVTHAQALSGLKTMEGRGRRARIFELTPPSSIDEDSFNQLSAASVKAGSICTSVAAEISVEGATNFDVLFDAAVAMSTSSPGTNVSTGTGTLTANAGRSGPGVGDGGGGDGEQHEKKANVGALMRTLEEGAAGPPRVGPLQWGWLPRVEADTRARKLYREAAHAQRRLLLMSDTEEETVQQEASRVREQIAVLTRNAARLESLAPTSARPSGANAAGATSRGEAQCTATARPNRGRHPTKARLRPLVSSSRLGRVDIFFTTEFHGGPLRQQDYGGYYPSDHEGWIDPASLSGCDASRGAASLAGGTPSSVSGRADAPSLAAGGRTTLGVGGRAADEPQKAWFSRKMLTAG